MDDLDNLLKQLGQVSAGPTSTTTGHDESELDALLNDLKSPPSSAISNPSPMPTLSSTPSFAGSLPIVTLPQPELIIPETIEDYRPSKFELFPPKPIPHIFGFSGPLRHFNPFKPAPFNADPEYLKKPIISHDPEIKSFDCDSGLIVHPDIGRKLEFPQYKFAEFITTIVYDPNTYSSLQKCIDNLPPYSILQIPEGKYVEDNRYTIKCKNPIFLQGIGDVVIKSGKKGDGALILCQEAVFENIKFECDEECNNHTITITTGVCRFSKCEFIGGQANAIQIEGKSYVELSDCKIKKSLKSGINVQDNAVAVCVNCTVKKCGFGVLAQNYAKLSMNHCKINKNEKSGFGIYDKTTISICNSNIVENKKMGMEVSSRAENIYFEANTFDSNGPAGALICQHSHVTFVNNIISNHSRTGFEVKGGSRLIMHGNKFSNSNENPLLLLNERSRAFSEKDSFSGQCRTAVAAVSESLFIGRYDKFENLAICGILTYDSGQVSLQMCEFSRIHGPSIQARSKSILNLRNCTFSETSDNLLFIGLGVTGKATNCNFEKAKIGVEVSEGIENYVFDNCKFVGIGQTGTRVRGKTSPKFLDCKFADNYIGCQIVEESTPLFEFCEFSKCKNGCVISNNAEPNFLGCTFTHNINYGFESVKSNPTFTNCQLSRNEQLGFSILKESNVNMLNCLITENEETGGQIGELGTMATFKGCVICKQINKYGLLVQNAEIKCINCQFFENESSHIHVLRDSVVKIQDSELTHSVKGVGIESCDARKISIKNSKLFNEMKSALIATGRGNVNVENTSVYECQQFGLWFQDGCKFDIKNCEIKDNMKIGIYIKSAYGSVNECTVTNNQVCGIDYDGEIDVSNNRYASNTKDINQRANK
ncbi:hypothetical protein TRFO_28298 [Tritrichomonas foetus]|uniref:Right handed beta helix domain-containing protein n=1 Tax=Tritrichomonas foetus TaxID=1144522 RepID=A0A1J4K0H8_9EUKA|nr:hypothetical protein TRFO_28298 [Tritrichomonas foetus]|eukprot:OHT04248.1 hypothetical protein TRFO_28298 [Tritrichomonas foetus]